MQDIQMVDLRGQYLAMKGEMDAALQQVLDSTSFIRGPFVEKFESELAQYLGGRHAIGVANGTDALQIAFMALGLGPGDEVITTAFTFIATAEAAALLGAVPVFADIDAGTFNIDPGRIEELVTPRTRAIVPVHLFGQPADMAPILDIAARHDLAVVEDNAQAIGSDYRDRRTGLLGDFGALSFFPSKNLGAYGDGGAIVTNDDKLFERARMIANHGSRRKYYNEIVGVNSRLDALQAAVLRVKLRHLESFIQSRREAADRYDDLLGASPYLTIPARDPQSRHVFHQYTIRLSRDLLARGGREAFTRFLNEKGIPSAIYYPVPLHRLPVFAERTAMRHGPLPETERAAEEVVSLPMHTELTMEQQAYIAEVIHDYVDTTLSA